MVARDEQFHVNRAVGSGELQMKLVEKSHRLPILEDSGESEAVSYTHLTLPTPDGV